jgi:serpin B
MFSPVSLNMALGMVSEGAVGETKEQLSNYLGTDNYSAVADKIVQRADEATFVEEPMYKYREARKSDLSIADSIWVNNKYELKEDYRNKVEKHYKAEANEVDYENDKEGAVDQMNKWCNEKTNGLIPQIVDNDSISSDTASVLVSTLCFKSKWRAHWTREYTDWGFKNIDGKHPLVSMIKSETDNVHSSYNKYYETEYFRAFRAMLDNELEFIGVISKEGDDFKVSDIFFEKLFKRRYEFFGYLTIVMPELDLSITMDDEIINLLTDPDQGVKNIFSREKSDLGRMINHRDTNNNSLSIDKIIQKTRIVINNHSYDYEETEPLVVSCAGMSIGHVHMFLNKPYVFFIYDRKTDEIIFAGKVVKF